MSGQTETEAWVTELHVIWSTWGGFFLEVKLVEQKLDLKKKTGAGPTEDGGQAGINQRTLKIGRGKND